MKRKQIKKDTGTIFNPVMYTVVLLYSVMLFLLFISFRQVTWLHNSITNSMTDALLAAITFNEEELLSYGKTDEAQILYPAEKYARFRDLLQEEMGLEADLSVGVHTLPLLTGQVRILDLVVYSIKEEDVTVYDFDENGNYETLYELGMKGILTAPNGEVITESALFARIGLTIDYLGTPVEVTRYHMVDVVDE